MAKLFDWLRRSDAAPPAADTVLPHERKSMVNPLVALHGFGEANWCATDYAGLAREGYLKNPVVHRCVRMIAEAGASLPFLLFDGEMEMDTHPLLALLQNPNPRQAGAALMEALYASLMVAGNAYLTRIDMDGRPRELHLLRADRMAPVLDETGWPIAYDHAIGARKVRYETGGRASPLLHIALYNPLADHEGYSPLGAAHMALDIHNAASRWNKALLDNSARPSGALVYAAGETGNLTEEQFERLKGELESGYAGASRAGRPMLLEGGLDWKAMAYSPKDMDFIEARNGAARDIALAFGVPPMLLGIPGDNTYSNYQEANRAFWRQTVLPMAGRVASALEGWLGADFGAALRLDFDRDKIEALATDREALWRRVNAASFLTIDEKRAATGYGALGDEAVHHVDAE